MKLTMKELGQQWLHIALACVVTATGLIVLKHAHIVTGGTAGLSLSLSYLFHMQFHYMFILLNIPFLLFSYFKLGRSFTLRTIIAISLLSAMTSIDNLLPAFVILPIIGSIVGGILIGVGISALFKNGASFGGSTILALFMQKKYQLDPGKTNFAFDFLVVLTSFSAISLSKGLVSIVSIAVTSSLISFFKSRQNNLRKPERNAVSTAATT